MYEGYKQFGKLNTDTIADAHTEKVNAIIIEQFCFQCSKQLGFSLHVHYGVPIYSIITPYSHCVLKCFFSLACVFFVFGLIVLFPVIFL